MMYRQFEDKAFKLRNNMDVNTWTGFEGFKLVLKQKQKDSTDQKYDWVIFDEYSPKPSDAPAVGKGQVKKIGGKASTIISKDIFNTMAFLSGYPADIKEEEIVEKVRTDFIEREDKKLITDITLAKKGSVVLHFSKHDDMMAFVKKNRDRQFLGKPVRLFEG